MRTTLSAGVLGFGIFFSSVFSISCADDKNIVVNGSFSDGLNNWQYSKEFVSLDNEDYHSPPSSGRIAPATNDVDNPMIYQKYTPEKPEKGVYELSYWVKTDKLCPASQAIKWPPMPCMTLAITYADGTKAYLKGPYKMVPGGYYRENSENPISKPSEIGKWIFKKQRFFADKPFKELIIYAGINRNNGGTLWVDDVKIVKIGESTEAGKTGNKKSSHLKLFDFGRGDTPVRASAEKITVEDAYTPGKAFGWKKGARLGKQSLKWFATHSTKADRIKPCDLTGDFIFARNADFVLEMPNGKYYCALISGDEANLPDPYSNIRISAQGKNVYDKTLSFKEYLDEYFHKNKETDFSYDQDLFDKYFKDRFTKIIFPIEVKDGKIDLHIQGSGRGAPVNALIVSDSKENLEKALAEQDEQSRKYFKDRFYFKEAGLNPEEKSKEPEYGEKAKQRGFAVFGSSYTEDIHPWTAEKENLDSIKIFATPGEREPFTLNLRPFRKDTIKVEVSKLSGSEGIIPEPSLKTGFLRYAEQRLGIEQTERINTAAEKIIYRNEFKVEPGITRGVWFQLELPSDTKPGTYKGTVSISGKNGKAEIPFECIVLPFILPELNGFSIGMFYNPPALCYKNRKKPEVREYIWSRIAAELEDMKKHNCNSIGLHYWNWLNPIKYKDGKVSINFKDMDRFVELYKKTGFKSPLYFYSTYEICTNIYRLVGGKHNSNNIWSPETTADPLWRSEKFKTAMHAALKTLYDHAKEKNWPEFYFAMGDELSHSKESIKWGVEMGKILKEIKRDIPQMKTAITTNGPGEAELLPYLDYMLPNFAAISKDFIEKIKKAGVVQGVYNLGPYRFTFGYYLRRIGSFLNYQWKYGVYYVDPYTQLDGPAPGWYVALPSENGPLPTVAWERVSEGIDDLKYLALLENLIGMAEKQGKINEKNRAESLIREIMQKIPWNPSLNVNFEAAGSSITMPFSPEEMNIYRWKIAQEIIKLRKILGIKTLETSLDTEIVTSRWKQLYDYVPEKDRIDFSACRTTVLFAPDNESGKWVKGDPGVDPVVPELTVSTAKSPDGKKQVVCLDFNIDYNKGGNPKYPRGWPMVHRKIDSGDEKYDMITFDIYPEGKVENENISLQYGISERGEKAKDYIRLRGKKLPKNKWTKISAAFPFAQNVKGLWFYISEASYNDKDNIKFYLKNIKLHKIVKPTFRKVKMDKIFMSGASKIPVKLFLGGDLKGKTLTWSILENGKETESGSVNKLEKNTNLDILVKKALNPGNYTLRLEIRDGKTGNPCTELKEAFEVVDFNTALQYLRAKEVKLFSCLE